MSFLLGQRGIGKTTTLIQWLLSNVSGDVFSEKILYIQADHFLMGSHTLYEITQNFASYGGKWIAFDEIHKYPDWSKELKSIYDTFPELQILVSGSSALKVYKGSHDLSRRGITYNLHGLSFREYLEMNLQIDFKTYSLEEICKNHTKITSAINQKLQDKDLKILPLFEQYLKIGYYPYFQELQKNEDVYRITLEQNIHTIIESDLPAIFPKLTGSSIKKIKQLLIFIADSVPFTPNWQKIGSLLDIGDQRTLKNYFKYLEDAGLIRALCRATKKMKKIEAPEKVYLDNTNQLFAIASLGNSEKGTVRETFFLSMVSKEHLVTLPNKGDFLVDDNYCFEIGGKKKGFDQIKTETTGYVVCDDIEQGFGSKVPLWLFGFLY